MTVASGTAGEAQADALQCRLEALVVAARFHGLQLDARDFHGAPGGAVPSPAALVTWLRESGLWAKAVHLRWRQLLALNSEAPVVLLCRDGSAALLVARDPAREVVFLKDPRAPAGDPPVAVDELRLSDRWDGVALLVRKARGGSPDEEPFTLGWLGRLVLGERRILREIVTGSLTLSVLQILPPFLVMVAIDRVLTHHSMSTLALIGLILVVVAAYETLLGWARREIVEVMSTRLDARLNLHVFSRLLALPVDFFERTPTGGTTHRISQIFKIRDFLTGKLLNTVLDAFTLVVLLPFLFWISAPLAWMVLAASVAIAVVIAAFLPAIRRVWAKLVEAETKKGAVLVETLHGIRTVKALGLENVRKLEWDERVAEAGQARLETGRMSNWAQTLVTPIERFIDRGVLMIGAYIVLSSPGAAGVSTGALIAFMLLGTRVAGPLIGLAKLIQDVEDVRSSVQQVGEVLNNPTETAATRTGLRPAFAGAISFSEVSFSYPGSKALALDRVSFEVPAGTMLGVVGRSGSGKSTLTRLLQGINRDFAGFVKLDGNDLREINLAYLRQNVGVVMQDNFLFRGTVLDNIIAGRPNLTLEHAVRAARLAAADEFIERLPRGYETWIEEGAANLSGGQRQRLAIARALVADPRIVILDEATSALDPESEALVHANLLRIAEGRTMVIVSHRLASLIECDQILVMDRGRVVDIGRHDDLVETCAIYRHLWQQQNRHAESGGRRAAPKPVAAAE